MRTFIVGTVEYLELPVECSVALDSQQVEISLDNDVTWLTAEWEGAPGSKRTARVLLGADNPLPAPGLHKVRVRITDLPEIPIITAGSIRVLT